MLASNHYLVRGVFRPRRLGVDTILPATKQLQLKSELEGFLQQIPFPVIAKETAAESSHDAGSVLALLETYANESRATLELILMHLQADSRILEIGAGLCLTSLFLKKAGYDVTALEPALGGFGMFELIKEKILQQHEAIGLGVLNKPAQELNADSDGQFDLIFSNNVLEHIPDWPAALSAMGGVLKTNGRMLHACPNYTVPYEPHYGVPVFRHLPKLSKRLFLASRGDDEIWDSLNFITGRNLKLYCNNHGLNCCFKKGLLYIALKRIEDDPLFEQRHRGKVASLAKLLLRTGLAKWLRHIPPTLATPMVAEISRQNTD